jgi:hypothetical protein
MSQYTDERNEFAKAQTERPAYVTEEHLDYLDALRESGATNMFGARPYVLREFPELSPAEASGVLSYWMKSFGERQKAATNPQAEGEEVRENG